VIGCLLRTIFIVVVLLIMPLRCVCQGVDQSNHQIIYFYIVIFLDQFDTLFRPFTMDLLKASSNTLNHWKTMLKMSGKMMWMKEVMKP